MADPKDWKWSVSRVVAYSIRRAQLPLIIVYEQQCKTNNPY